MYCNIPIMPGQDGLDELTSSLQEQTWILGSISNFKGSGALRFIMGYIGVAMGIMFRV